MSDAPILRYFAWGHLPEGPLRETSRRFAVLAHELAADLQPGAELSTALRKLLEAKDAAVRSALDSTPAMIAAEGVEVVR